MKFAVAMLSLVISANVFAYSLADSTGVTSAVPLLTSYTTVGGFHKEQAAAVLNDAQDFIQSGKVSALLSQKIKETQELNSALSADEALDAVINDAQSILND